MARLSKVNKLKAKDKKWLYKHYIQLNMRVEEIADILQTTKSTVERYLKKHDIKKSQKLAKALSQETNLKKYGFNVPTKCLKVKEKTKQTNYKKYGVPYAMMTKETQLKKENTNLTRYKHKHAMQNIDVLKKTQNTNVKKYGDVCTLKNSKIKEKAIETILSRYGTANAMQNEDIKQKFKTSFFNKYGVTSPYHLEEVINKMINTRQKNGNLITVNGLTVKDMTDKYRVSPSYIRSQLKLQNTTDEEFLYFLDTSKQNHMNSLEFKIYQALNLPFFNKQATSTMKYKPDFQLNDTTYINVDGLYWHSELQVPNKYHFDMRQQYERHDLRILQFREDEVNEKLDIIVSMVNNILGKNTKIFARKTKLHSVTQKQATDFLDKNHMMGSTTAKHIGLFHKEDLVMLVSYKMFGKVLKIERMCSKTHINVVGGFSKLLKYLEKMLNPKQIDYWVDLRYGTGNFLKTLGFIHKRDTLGWRWTDGLTTYNRRRIRANMDKDNLKEREYANKLGVIKIYDAGQRLFVKNV